MKKILPLILAFNIGQCFGEDSFKVLTQDMDKLNHKILKTEHILSRELPEKERNDLEKLKQHLTEIKSHFMAYNDSKGLEIAIALTEKKGWTETNSFLHKIQTSCSIEENLEKDCFVELSNFDNFVATRALSQSDKETLLNLMATYAKFSEAKLVLNNKFENVTNELLKNYNSSFLKEERPLATVSLAPAGTMKSDVVKKSPLAEKKMESNDSIGGINMVLVYKYHLMGIVGALVALTFYRRSSGKKRELKSFYSSIFITAKKKRVKARIFGNVNPGNVVKVRKIKKSLLALLDSSTVFNANMDVKIRNRGKKVVIDTVFHVQKTIQELSSMDAYSSFARELEEIEKSLHDFGGELSITNTFDNEGKLNGTYFTIVV